MRGYVALASRQCACQAPARRACQPFAHEAQLSAARSVLAERHAAHTRIICPRRLFKGDVDMTWSAWHRFSEMTRNPTEALRIGVYQVRATSQDGEPVTIPRACEFDSEGILYIGCGFLPDRVGRLMRIFEEDPKLHHHFIPVFFHYGLERICKRQFLVVRWAECENPAFGEARLIDDYRKRTGDIPPGNRKLGARPAEPTADLEESSTGVSPVSGPTQGQDARGSRPLLSRRRLR
jgi:hypothetical protein